MNKNESFKISQIFNGKNLANLNVNFDGENVKENVREKFLEFLKEAQQTKGKRYLNDIYSTLNNSFDCLAIYSLPFRIDIVRNYVKTLNILETDKELSLKELLEFNNIDPYIWLTQEGTVKKVMEIAFESFKTMLKEPKQSEMKKKEIKQLYNKEYFKYQPYFPLEFTYEKSGNKYSTYEYNQDKDLQSLYIRDFVSFLIYVGYEFQKDNEEFIHPTLDELIEYFEGNNEDTPTA